MDTRFDARAVELLGPGMVGAATATAGCPTPPAFAKSYSI